MGQHSVADVADKVPVGRVAHGQALGEGDKAPGVVADLLRRQVARGVEEWQIGTGIDPVGLAEADGIDLDAIAHGVERAPQHEIADGRFDQQTLGHVAARKGQVVGGGGGAVVLDGAEDQIGYCQHQTLAHGQLADQADEQGHQQREGEDRVDDGNDAPGHRCSGEGPEQVGAVAGAGIEQPAGAVAEQGIAVECAG